MGFELNPYDLCVENASIEVKKCTVCWYVDAHKIGHMDPKVFDKVIKTIEGKFGNMPQARGDKNDFLGMNIKFKDKKVKISMKKNIQKATDTFMDDIPRNAKLSEEKSEDFHSVVASLLFISRRCK